MRLWYKSETCVQKGRIFDERLVAEQYTDPATGEVSEDLCEFTSGDEPDEAAVARAREWLAVAASDPAAGRYSFKATVAENVLEYLGVQDEPDAEDEEDEPDESLLDVYESEPEAVPLAPGWTATTAHAARPHGEPVYVCAEGTCAHPGGTAHSLREAVACGILPAVRTARGHSQADAARAMHLSVDTVQNWEQGRKLPGPELYAEALRRYLVGA